MANTFKFGNGNWAVKDGFALAYNDENNNFKPLPFDFTRASSATRVNKDGLIETVPSNKPRIDFLNNTSGHLLLEPSRTNSILYSEDFSNASWLKYDSVSVTINDSISPDGNNTATTLSNATGTSRNSNVLQFNASGLSSSTAYTFSVYVKSTNTTNVQLGLFDASTGVNNNQDFTVTSSWQRISFTATTGASTTFFNAYIGDTSGDISIWAAQLEAGSYATSYIPTEGSSVTRSDDYAIDAGNSDVFSNTELSWFLDIEGFAEDGTNRYISISDNGGSPYTNGYNVLYRSDGNLRIFRNGLDFADAISIVNIDQTVRQKIAIRFKQDDMKVYINGTAQTLNSSYVFQSMSGIDSMRFTQQNSTTSNAFDGKIYYMRVWNEALTDTELKNLTS